MKIYILIILILLNSISCKSSKDVRVSLSYVKKINCLDYCNIIEIEIKNNSKKNVYLPDFGNYMSNLLCFDKHNININEFILKVDFENIEANDVLFFNNKGRPYIQESNAIKHTIPLIHINYIKHSKEYRDNINRLSENQFRKYIKPYLSKKLNNNDKVIYEKEEFINFKFGGILFLEKNSSIIITKNITSLVKSNKFDSIKVLYKYKAMPIIEDVDKTDYFLYSLSYFDEKLEKKIKIDNKYPKKILGKYHLISELKSKDTLTINIK